MTTLREANLLEGSERANKTKMEDAHMGRLVRPHLIAAVLMYVVLAAAAEAECTYYVTDISRVTTYGPYYDKATGQYLGQVPLYTTITLYWSAECHWDDPIYLPPPNEGDPPPPYETQLYVRNVRVNTVDPWRPTITADVTSTHTSHPPAEVLLLIDGHRHTAIYPNANGTYTFAMPAIGEFGDVTTHLDIEACDSEYRCATGNAEMTRATPSALKATDTLHVWRYEGKNVKKATYGHAFRQVYATTSFSVLEEGENSRYQLKENSVQLAWDVAPAVFSAEARSQIGLYSNTIGLGRCSWGEPVCYSEGCRAACGYFASFGAFAPSVTETITEVFTENAEAWMITLGAELTVHAP